MRNPFLNALPVIANALADTLGVTVVMNAGQPRTNGNTIFLPTLDGDKPESRMLGIGYVAHEGGHCRFSDFNLLKQMTPLEKHISNILEDIYIEKSMANVFPGVKLYLAEMIEALVEMKFFSEPPADATPAQLMQSFMLYRLRADLLEQDGIAELADKMEARLRENVPIGMCTRLEALMFQVDECKNSQDVLDLARTIIKMMEDEAKKEEEKEQQEKEDQNQGQPDPSQPQDQSQSDDSSQQQDGDEEGQPEAGQEKGEGDDDDAPQQDGGSGSSDDDQTASDIIKSILSAGDDEAIKSTDEALEEALGSVEADCSIPSNVMPFKSKGFPHKPAPQVNIEADKNRVSAASNALRVRTQSLLQAQTQAVKRNTMMGTKLNVKNLHRARMDGQVFQKTKEGIKIDTAIAILVDRSGSMSGDKILLALDAAALAATMAFDRPGVKTAVYAFPYCDGAESNVMMKHWDAQPASVIPSYQRLGVDGSTPLAEAIMGVGIDLMNRPEARKVILVATDGDPDNLAQSHWVVDLARKSGMEVLGIGIMSNAIKVFGQQWASNINDIEQLPTAMIGMLENIMLKKAA